MAEYKDREHYIPLRKRDRSTSCATTRECPLSSAASSASSAPVVRLSGRQANLQPLAHAEPLLPNLDSNGGVIHHLLDEAEEQERREAILAYYYLCRYAGENGWSPANLDDYVELDLERLANLKVDFEIEVALDKLEKLNVVEKVDGRYRAHTIEKALEMLDWTWDNYFKYNNPEPETPPIPAK